MLIKSLAIHAVPRFTSVQLFAAFRAWHLGSIAHGRSVDANDTNCSVRQVDCKRLATQLLQASVRPSMPSPLCSSSSSALSLPQITPQIYHGAFYASQLLRTDMYLLAPIFSRYWPPSVGETGAREKRYKHQHHDPIWPSRLPDPIRTDVGLRQVYATMRRGSLRR